MGISNHISTPPPPEVSSTQTKESSISTPRQSVSSGGHSITPESLSTTDPTPSRFQSVLSKVNNLMSEVHAQMPSIDNLSIGSLKERFSNLGEQISEKFKELGVKLSNAYTSVFGTPDEKHQLKVLNLIKEFKTNGNIPIVSKLMETPEGNEIVRLTCQRCFSPEHYEFLTEVNNSTPLPREFLVNDILKRIHLSKSISAMT